MAKKRNNQMFGRIRGRVEKAFGRRRKHGIAGSAVSELRSAFGSVKGRVTGPDPKRSQAAKKAARTRARNAEKAKRSAAARTRARAGSR
jgi:hypothetical protein